MTEVSSSVFGIRATLALIGLSVVCAAGCGPDASGNPTTYPVTGKVTRAGKPVDGATIVFVPADEKGIAATGITDAAGEYKMTTFAAGDGVTPGSYKVRLTQFEKEKVDASKMGTVTFEQEQQQYDPDAKPPAPAKNLLPPKYESEHKSGLTHEVVTSPTTFDITIE